MPKTGAAVFITTLLWAANLSAQNYELRYDPVVDGIVTGSAVLFWLSAETILKKPLSPKTCRWCEAPGFDKKLREDLIYSNQAVPKKISDVNLAVSAVIGFGGIAALGALDGQGDDFLLNAVLLTETVAVAMSFTNLVKWAVARRRPDTAETAFARGSNENNLSFFSGHATFTTVFGAAAGTIAMLRNYRYAEWILGLGLGLGAFTSVMRIGADAHYFSDVLTGFIVGTGFGIGIPLLFHARKKEHNAARVSPVPGGLSFTLVF